MKKEKHIKPERLEIEYSPNLKIVYRSDCGLISVYRDGVLLDDVVAVEIPKLFAWEVLRDRENLTEEDMFVKLTFAPMTSYLYKHMLSEKPN